MKESDKREADVLFALGERAWAQFNERRKYELQLSFAFWTALALAVAGSLQLSSLPSIPLGRIALVMIAALPIVLHIAWHVGIRSANSRDRYRAIDYQTRIHQLAGNFSYSPKTLEAISQRDGKDKSILHWSHTTQIGITVFLAACLVIANWSRFEASSIARQSRLADVRATRDSIALATEHLQLFMLKQDSLRPIVPGPGGLKQP